MFLFSSNGKRLEQIQLVYKILYSCILRVCVLQAILITRQHKNKSHFGHLERFTVSIASRKCFVGKSL